MFTYHPTDRDEWFSGVGESAHVADLSYALAGYRLASLADAQRLASYLTAVHARYRNCAALRDGPRHPPRYPTIRIDAKLRGSRGLYHCASHVIELAPHLPLTTLLHELAHHFQPEDERDHGPTFNVILRRLMGSAVDHFGAKVVTLRERLPVGCVARVVCERSNVYGELVRVTRHLAKNVEVVTLEKTPNVKGRISPHALKRVPDYLG